MTQEQPDKSILSTVGILYVAFGGLGCFFSLFPLLHIFMFGYMTPSVSAHSEQIPPFFAILFIGFSAIMIFIGELISILMIFAGLKMRSFKSYKFVLFVSVVSLFFFPFGTVLGILSIIFLQKPANKELFGA